MKKSEVTALSNVGLLAAFHWNTVSMVHEVNSRTGFTKATRKELDWILTEMASRFNLDKAALENELNR